MKIDLERLKKNSCIAVGVSGGRDSMALLHYLATIQAEVGFLLKAVCVEHGIRPNATHEAEGVQEFCKSLGIECKVFHVKAVEYAKEQKLTLEQSARELRYNCFRECVERGYCDYIATAHHQSDNVETILMRIFRGTGNKGLQGIGKERDYFIRPMLSVTRLEIDQYIQKNNIPYFEDESNFDTAFTRNFIRHEVLPVIKKQYENVEKSITRLSELSQKDEEHFSRLVNSKIVDLDGAWGVCVKDIEDLAVFDRIVRECFVRLGVLADVEDRHVTLIENLAYAENGLTLDMPYGVTAVKEYSRIVFYKAREKDLEEIPFQENFDFELCGKRFSTIVASQREEFGLYIDGEVAKGGVFRTKREGDVFKRFGGGTKSLGDYLTDKKIPLRQREELVVLAKGNEILAILGVEISEKAKITDKTQRIIRLEENYGQD